MKLTIDLYDFFSYIYIYIIWSQFVEMYVRQEQAVRFKVVLSLVQEDYKIFRNKSLKNGAILVYFEIKLQVYLSGKVTYEYIKEFY